MEAACGAERGGNQRRGVRGETRPSSGADENRVRWENYWKLLKEERSLKSSTDNEQARDRG